jgi:hypothetical protein
MSINPTPGLINVENKPISWRKKYRPQLMNTSFVFFCAGFPLSYLGGISDDHILIWLSFVAFCAACIIPLVTQK